MIESKAIHGAERAMNSHNLAWGSTARKTVIRAAPQLTAPVNVSSPAQRRSPSPNSLVKLTLPAACHQTLPLNKGALLLFLFLSKGIWVSWNHDIQGIMSLFGLGCYAPQLTWQLAGCIRTDLPVGREASWVGKQTKTGSLFTFLLG